MGYLIDHSFTSFPRFPLFRSRPYHLGLPGQRAHGFYGKERCSNETKPCGPVIYGGLSQLLRSFNA